jgi:hypothetical protein
MAAIGFIIRSKIKGVLKPKKGLQCGDISQKVGKGVGPMAIRQGVFSPGGLLKKPFYESRAAFCFGCIKAECF